MKRVLIFIASVLFFTGGGMAAVRDGGVAVRAKNSSNTSTQQRLTSTTKTSRAAVRKSTLTPRETTTNVKTTTSRAATSRATGTTTRAATARSAAAPNQTPIPRVVARAATETTDMGQTRTGAEYERCKTAYFTCMDQFCGLKNDDYRRCACSNRVYDLTAARETLTLAGEKLTVFTENLEAVGMTAAQAAAMKTASEGENALTEDKSASKALLQAILNSIRGEDSSVGGKLSDLNSINISFDNANAFGTMDAGQAIAKYDGQNLYSAVYPQCRAAVKADCNDASLQRAITAYLMSIEQDCNTVETAINNKRKEMKSAVREGSAMLDLARVENRQKHNSSDIATCIADVETAILNEQVCGANYHKCLDNGEFIDITTGAPIEGVTDFYKLAEMLTFADGVEAANQKLSKNTANRTFVSNFEKRTKKFAADALDKCVEDADTVWSEYLDKALLDIYYAQRAKVDVIKQSCFDIVSTCYMNSETSITAAMKELTGEDNLTIQPDRVGLTGAMCTNYVNSCNSLFSSNIIKDYIDQRQETDTLAACRAVVKQCFDSFGGANYENFYYPYSGLFTPNTGSAPDWFTLYEVINKSEYDKMEEANDGNVLDFFHSDKFGNNMYVRYKSTCAKQLAAIESCSAPEIIEAAFGGFDKVYAKDATASSKCDQYDVVAQSPGAEETDTPKHMYGTLENKDNDKCLRHRITRASGVATEVYNQVIDILTNQCTNLQGRFIETQFGRIKQYDPNNLCMTNFTYTEAKKELAEQFSLRFTQGETPNPRYDGSENMCPRDYVLSVDTLSWGMCSCWENGGRRSKDGTTAKCLPIVPAAYSHVGSNLETVGNDAICPAGIAPWTNVVISLENKVQNLPKTPKPEHWCTRDITSSDNQICPLTVDDTTTNPVKSNPITTRTGCDAAIKENHTELPDGLSM